MGNKNKGHRSGLAGGNNGRGEMAVTGERRKMKGYIRGLGGDYGRGEISVKGSVMSPREAENWIFDL